MLPPARHVWFNIYAERHARVALFPNGDATLGRVQPISEGIEQNQLHTLPTASNPAFDPSESNLGRASEKRRIHREYF